MRLWQAKSIGLDQQTGEAAGEVLHLTRFRPITEPSNADKFSGRRFAASAAIRNCSIRSTSAKRAYGGVVQVPQVAGIETLFDGDCRCPRSFSI
jgi:hypothetical protein